MHRQIIASTINTDKNVFDAIIHGITMDFTKCVSNIKDMQDRDSMKRKGDIWELFCKDWLLATGEYQAVYLLDEYNALFGCITRQDNGIDLLAQTMTGGWHAIQCKYRSKGYVTWKMLSTFIALCERTGPWDKYIVMTNAPGVTHKLPRTPKDKSICYRRFANTPREHWMRIIGTDRSFRRLCDETIDALVPTTQSTTTLSTTTQSTPIKPIVIRKRSKPIVKTCTLSLDELREQRLKRFES